MVLYHRVNQGQLGNILENADSMKRSNNQVSLAQAQPARDPDHPE
jgi:hypothetical protein